MRPYPKPQLGDQRKNIFNDRLSRARKVVEDIIASYSLSNLPRQGGNHQVAAFNVRENFARFFDSPEGALNY